jgi:hypothetical protein
MRTFEEYERILTLYEEGLTHTQIAEKIDIPRATVRDCIKKFGTLGNLHRNHNQSKYQWRSRLSEESYRQQYAYLLGLYPGDGHINLSGRAYKLRIFLDSRYPNIIESCRYAIRVIVPNNSVNVHKHPVHNLVIITTYSTHWTEIFPQHGEGMKHTRAIVLEKWQQEIIDEFPIDFGRGLYHSDGTRIEPVINGKIYLRYEFTNMSPDIFKMFCDTVEKLGLSWTAFKPRITIARRQHVEYLDTVWGRKS